MEAREEPYGKDVSGKGIKVDKSVNPNISKRLHTSIVIGCRINVVDSDGVGSKLLHQGSVSLALLSIDEGIIRTKLISNT